jgi:hypothetical protein
VVREHEILRVYGELDGDHAEKSSEAARAEVLKWVEPRSGGRLPGEAWAHESFEYLSGGRNCSAIRIVYGGADIWGIRAEEPDKTVAGRTWTTEVTIGLREGKFPKFSLRSLVSTPEANLDIAPHTPGLVQQVTECCRLSCGPYVLSPMPWIIDREERAERLIEYMIDQDRELPIIVLSVSEFSEDRFATPLNAVELARATIGLANVAILPAQFSWLLTERFGKRLSVFGSAVRLYLPGFTEDADPYGGHLLVMPEKIATGEKVADWTRRLRWIVASESIRRTRLDTDVLAFSTIKSANLKFRQERLVEQGASEGEQLAAAQKRIEALEEQARRQVEWEQELSDEHSQAEERAKAAEAHLKSSAFRIQQLLAQLKERGDVPDANIHPPNSWKDFADWCETNLAGRVILTPKARRAVKAPLFNDPARAARCLIWLANECRDWKLNGGDGTIGEYTIEPGCVNSHCGSDEFSSEWQGRPHTVSWF